MRREEASEASLEAEETTMGVAVVVVVQLARASFVVT